MLGNFGVVGEQPIIPNDTGIKEVNYLDIVKLVDSFASFDISASGTGYTLYNEGVLTIGEFKVEGDSLLEKRRFFRNKVKELIGDTRYDTIFVEDVIGSVNFETARLLYQLNCIIDDMKDLGFIDYGEMVRVDNKVWKSRLKKVASYNSQYYGHRNDKEITQICLSNIGYDIEGKTDNETDSLGMALGMLFSKEVEGTELKDRKLKTNIESGYTIKQYKTLQEAEKHLQRKKEQREIVKVDIPDNVKSLTAYFKSMVIESNNDNYYYILKVQPKQIGQLIFKKNLEVDEPYYYLVAYN